MTDPTAFLSRENLRNPNEPQNIVDGLFAIAGAIETLATNVKYLGNGDATTPLGVIENLSMQVRDGLQGVAEGLRGDGSESEALVDAIDRAAERIDKSITIAGGTGYDSV